MLCLPQYVNEGLLRLYDHRENPDLAGPAKHPGTAGACGLTTRMVLNTLHGPIGILRNQETMQGQGAVDRRAALAMTNI